MSSKVFSKIDLYRLCNAERIAIEAEQEEGSAQEKYHWYHVSEKLQETVTKLHPGYLVTFERDLRQVATDYLERFNEFEQKVDNMTEKECEREQEHLMESISEDLKSYCIQN